MAKKSGLGQRLYVHGYDLSGDVGAINTFRVTHNAQDVTGIDKSAVERILTRTDGELSFNVWFNDATDQEHDALSTLPTTDRLALWLSGVTRGDPVFAISAKQVNYDWSRGADGALQGTVQLLSTGGIPPEFAELLVAKTTHSSATDESSLDGGAQSTSGAVGYLQHFSAGSGTVEYDIEDSANDSTFANLLAFTDVATPYTETAQRVAVDGTVERYVRASTNGTFTNAVFAIALRRREATDYDAA